MTRIVHIIDELKVGGAQTHLLTILRHLKEHYAFSHHVISLFGSDACEAALKELGIPTITLNLRPFLQRNRYDLAVSEIGKYLRTLEPDLVEAHLTWSRLLGLFAARILGISRCYGFEQGDIYLNSAKFRIANYLSQLYIKRYIVCSYAFQSWVQKTHHIPRNKLTVLHNCVDTTKFHPSVSPASDVVERKGESNVLVIMVGTLGSGVNKRMDIGIQAVAEARQKGINVSLAIAGNGAQLKMLEELACTLNISSNVHFLGTRSDIANVLKASDIFCHCAPFEPFGIVAIEAMATGLPVIVPQSGGVAEIVETDVTGLTYPALDVSSLSNAIITLAEDKERRARMGQQAHIDINRRFAVHGYVQSLYQLYGVLNS
jgi:glycosyltransferase involved in cell wall biosynthesis